MALNGTSRIAQATAPLYNFCKPPIILTELIKLSLFCKLI